MTLVYTNIKRENFKSKALICSLVESTDDDFRKLLTNVMKKTK